VFIRVRSSLLAGARWRAPLLALLMVALVATGAVVLPPATAAHATVGTDDYPPKYDDFDTWTTWGLARECTSFVEWRLNNDAGVPFTNTYRGVIWGDAGNWIPAATAAGVPINTTPTIGSVAVYPAWVQGAGGAGHVSWVIGVGNGTVTVEDYNFPDAYDNYQFYTYSQHVVATAGLKFVHFTGSGGTGYVTGTVMARPTLTVRNGPGTGYGITGTFATNARINISCYNVGTTVSGTWADGSTWTTNVWDGLRNNSTGKFNGTYVSDAWMNTGGNTANMVPHC
jgi:surface antigen